MLSHKASTFFSMMRNEKNYKINASNVIDTRPESQESMKEKGAQEPERRLRYIVVYLLVAVGLAGVILMAVSK